MIEVILAAIIITILPMALFGAVIFIQASRTKTSKNGYDTSNRFNPLKAVWQSATKPEDLAKYPEFAYLRLDVGEQADIIQKHFEDKEQ